MKKPLIVFALPVLAGVVLWLALLKTNTPLTGEAQQDRSFAKFRSFAKLPMSKQPRIEPLESWQPDGTTPKTIPENMRGATDDPFVVDLLNTYQKIEIGKIVTTENGSQQLWDGTKLLFEAKRIGSRSRTTDGTIALDAVTGEQPPIEDAEIIGTGDEARLISSPREIWLVAPTCEKTKISPPNMDAFAPVIEPNGKMIAFTGRLINEKGFPSAQRLYVGDPTTGQYRVFAEDAHLHHYQVWAVDWVENNTVLRVLQDHGETGGHMKLKQVRFE